jgi:hypothetical protein
MKRSCSNSSRPTDGRRGIVYSKGRSDAPNAIAEVLGERTATALVSEIRRPIGPRPQRRRDRWGTDLSKCP